jgi:hypothetical protein
VSKARSGPWRFHSGSPESLRSDIGFRAFYPSQIGKAVVEPSLKAAWEHAYEHSALPITAGLPKSPGHRRPSSARPKVTTVPSLAPVFPFN